jgi:hypothetical protein
MTSYEMQMEKCLVESDKHLIFKYYSYSPYKSDDGTTTKIYYNHRYKDVKEAFLVVKSEKGKVTSKEYEMYDFLCRNYPDPSGWRCGGETKVGFEKAYKRFNKKISIYSLLRKFLPYDLSIHVLSFLKEVSIAEFTYACGGN